MTETPRTERDELAGAVGTQRDAPGGPVPHGSARTTRDEVGRGVVAPGGHRVGPGAAEAATPYLRVNLPVGLLGEYRPLRELSSAGAEADLLVVEALDGSGTWVVKIYRPGIELDPRMLALIERADVEHVVASRMYGSSAGIWYEVLEHIHGGTLTDLLPRNGAGTALPDQRVRDILVQLHEALRALHAMGIVHRDIKPSNVLVRSHDPLDLVLADFGLATLLDRSWRLASASRTLAYAAPEAAHGHVSTARDYWSLGLILLEALTGEHPLADLDDAVIGIHLATRNIDVSAITNDRWRLLCRGLLVRDPAHRWGAQQIDQWLAGKSPTVVPDSTDLPLTPSPQPYVFNSREFTSPRDLVTAMAASWPDGARQLVAGSAAFTALTGWLLTRTSSGDLAAVIDDLSGVTNPDKRLATLIYAVAPDLPAVYRGFDLTGDGIIGLAEDARRNPDPAPSAPDSAKAAAVLSLWTDQTLAVLPGMRDTMQTWAQLRNDVDTHISTAADAGAGSAMPPHTEVLLAAYTLLVAADPTFPDRLTRLARAASTTGQTTPWFSTLGDDPASHIARIALAPIAQQQHQKREDKAAAIERSAASVLAAADGPAARYVAALEIERAAAAILPILSLQRETLPQSGEWLPPLPEGGPASTRVAALAAQFPLAAERLQAMGQLFAEAVTRGRQEGDRGVAEVPAMPDPPIDHAGIAPRRPGADPQAEGFRRVSIQALVAVIVAALDWIWGATSYKANNNSVGGLWFLQIAILIVCGFVIWAWFASINDGREGRERESAAKSTYDRDLAEYNRKRKEYLHLKDVWERAGLAHTKVLSDAEERRRRNHDAAADVDAMAQRLAAAARSLMEGDAFTALERIAMRVREEK